MVQKRRIGVITPIEHLEGVEELLDMKGDVFYPPDLSSCSKKDIRNMMIKEDIDTIICNPNKQGYVIDEEFLEGTKITTINTCSTGLNHIDMLYCKENKIKVLSLTKDYDLLDELPSTAELAFGLLLDLARNITESNNYTKSSKKWTYTPFIGNQIKDMKIGIVGYGRLGKMMAGYCKAFGAEVAIYDPYYKYDVYEDISTPLNRFYSLDELFCWSDSVSLHVHVTDETRYMINKNLIVNNKIKYLINTSRGEIVNEDDIIYCLENNFLEGYGTDVIEDEFGDIENSPIIKNSNSLYHNIIVTPHVGGMTIEGQTKAYKYAIDKLEDIQ